MEKLRPAVEGRKGEEAASPPKGAYGHSAVGGARSAARKRTGEATFVRVWQHSQDLLFNFEQLAESQRSILEDEQGKWLRT
jgi:hypothetical protein